MTISHALSGREDVSRFIVHLTRNDTDDFSDGASARKNLFDILRERTISAARPHCFFNRRIEKLDKAFRKSVEEKFSCVCLTEVPLNQIHLLTRKIPNRRIEFAPYGLIFRKEFVVNAGGQPAIYVNGYGGERWLHECVNALYDIGLKGGKLREPHWRILPFINAMHERYDFTWEREWRVLGDLKFRAKDIIAVILPSDAEENLKERLAGQGVATISPGWTYEQIVAELGRQQRATRSLANALAT